jgi:hypothetical protein
MPTWPPRHRDVGQSRTAVATPKRLPSTKSSSSTWGTYLALAGEDDWDEQRVPAYVERELRRCLESGILAYGFARARCPD